MLDDGIFIFMRKLSTIKSNNLPWVWQIVNRRLYTSYDSNSMNVLEAAKNMEMVKRFSGQYLLGTWRREG